MAQYRKPVNFSLGSIVTSRILSVTTAETLFLIGTGNRAFEATNYGPGNVYYGQSGILVNSGGLIPINNSKFWDSITGNFSIYFVNASGGITTQLVIQEYAGY